MVYEHIQKLKNHRNALYALVVILLVFQVLSFIAFSSNTARQTAELQDLRQELKSQVQTIQVQEQELQEALDDSDTLHQQNFNELAQAFARQQQAQSTLAQDLTLLKSTTGDFSGVVEGAVKSVVSVGTDRGSGSGFFVTSKGHVVTNYHVIARAKQIAVLNHDRDVIQAQLIGYDQDYDIALLQINETSTPAKLAESSKLSVGQKVIAIGNPLGLSFTVTEGIISALHREGPTGREDYIQTDVSLNPGNSGGPLINVKGEVIGINNFKVGDAESLGFALESDTVKAVVNRLANTTLIP